VNVNANSSTEISHQAFASYNLYSTTFNLQTHSELSVILYFMLHFKIYIFKIYFRKIESEEEFRPLEYPTDFSMLLLTP
jgi:hypothetical protein